MMRANAIFQGYTKGIFYIADADDGGMSITNDAENVVAYYNNYLPPNTKIVYRDTMGNWDELVHENGVFKDFARWDGPTP